MNFEGSRSKHHRSPIENPRVKDATLKYNTDLLHISDISIAMALSDGNSLDVLFEIGRFPKITYRFFSPYSLSFSAVPT